MLRRDFILVQIEEIAKVIAQLISNRNNGATRKNTDLIKVVYDSLYIDSLQLMRMSPEELVDHLNGDDNEGLRRLELAAKTLLEEKYLYPEKEEEINTRVKLILEYIQKNDTTFSLERMELINSLV